MAYLRYTLCHLIVLPANGASLVTCFTGSLGYSSSVCHDKFYVALGIKLQVGKTVSVKDILTCSLESLLDLPYRP